MDQGRQKLGEFFELDGFDHVAVEASLRRSTAIFIFAPTGESNKCDFLTPRLFSNSTGRVVTVEFRQADVEQYNVRSEIGCDF